MNKNSLIIALCLSYLDFLVLLKQWMNINTITDIDHFNINHERLNKNRNMDHFNFKHERLNNNSLILTLCFSYLDILLFFKQWININYNEKCGPFIFKCIRTYSNIFLHILTYSIIFWHILKYSNVFKWNVEHFNFKHDRLNKNSLIIALYLSYLEFLSFFKQYMNINYNQICWPI